MELKFYESPSFKKLQHHWDKKLFNSGFDDICRQKISQGVSKQYFTLNSKTGFTEASLDRCAAIMKVIDFENRKTKAPSRDRFVFESYANGRSLREIENELRNKYPRRLRLRKTQIGKLITDIIKEFDDSAKQIAKVLSKPKIESKKYNFYDKGTFDEQYLMKLELILKTFDFESRVTKSAARDRFVVEMRLNSHSLRDIEWVLAKTHLKRLRLRKTQIGKLLADVISEFDSKVNMIKGCAA